MTTADRAARRDYFLNRFPEIGARLAQGVADQFSVVVQDGEAVDIRIGDQQMYGGDAQGFARQQVAAYMEKPLRLFMNQLDQSGFISPVCVDLVHALRDQLVADGQEGLAVYPAGNPEFLVVFGLGLGHHVDDLVRRTQARWLIIVEPIHGFLDHSIDVIDWERLITDFEARGGSVHIVYEMDPGAMAAGITRIMDRHGIAFADGSWVFTHYPLWAFAEARKRLHEAIEFSFVNRGFFEDELRMMGNAVENFARQRFHLLEGKPRLRRPETAVIAGAGPSLDECMETLHRIRDRVVLFSCGTALRPLLRNGFVPDFHCELENVPEVFDVIGDAARYGDLKQISLVASSTVDPRVPALFGRKIFFFRDAVSSTQILGAPYRVLRAASPTCVNLGLTASAHMGFNDFVLVGADCGIRSGGKIHAEGTVYRDIGMWQEKDQTRKHPIELEGNFGGVVHTDWVYDACRLMLAGAIGQFKLNVTNCSDGALIPGARPCVPESLRISGPVVDRAEFHATLDRSMRLFSAGEILRDVDFTGLRGHARDVFARLDGLLAEIAGYDADFAKAYETIDAVVGELETGYGHTGSIVTGTLNGLPRIAMFFGFRVTDPVIRQRLYDRYVAEVRATLVGMADRSVTLFDNLDATIASEPNAATA